MSTGSSDDISPRVIAAVGHDAPFALLVLMDLPTEDASVIAKLKEVSKIAADGTAKEEGCKLYSFYQDIDLPQRYFLAEKWQNVTALIKHLSATHVAPLLAFLSEEKVATNIRVLAHIATPLIAPVPSATNPLPALAPDRGTVISVRVAAKQSDDKPYFMIVSADIAKSEDPSKNPIHALTEAAKPNTDYAATADGCEFWEVCVDVDAPLERIVVLQSWRDAAAGKAFMGNPHLKLWRESTMAASAKSGFAAGIPLH